MTKQDKVLPLLLHSGSIHYAAGQQAKAQQCMREHALRPPPWKCTPGPQMSRTLSLQLAPLSRHILAQSQFYTYLVT